MDRWEKYPSNGHWKMVEEADLVTEMTEIKHPFRAGVKAQAGVEF